MYKVVIADDDKTIQKGLQEEIEWEALGFEVVGTCDDGEDVIEILNSIQVDVVVTDVKMLHVDGIEIAKYVYESKLPCKVVFISGYKEFEIARSALQYGVMDYLLKPTVEDEVLALLRKIRKELDIMYNDMELRCKIDSYWSELKVFLAKKFVSGLLHGALDEKMQIQERLNIIHPDLDAEKCPCMHVSIEIIDYENFIQKEWKYETELFYEAIDNFLILYKKLGYFHVAYKNMGRINMLVFMKDYCNTPDENVAMCKMCLEELARSFREIFTPDIVINIEKVFTNIFEVTKYGLEINQTRYLLEQKKEILTNIMEGNIGLAQNIMKSSLQCFADKDVYAGIEFVRDTVDKISELLKNRNPVQMERMSPFLKKKNLSSLHSVADIEQYCNRIFERMKSEQGRQKQYDESHLINQIKEYVDQHIYEDVCLDDVANYVFISSRHLSRTFKEQTGETFLQYVTYKKMEKAAELLLKSGMKVYQVSEMLGYKTAWYFSKLFYDFYGCNPSEYQHDVQPQGEESK